jgi:hypothetical protein
MLFDGLTFQPAHADAVGIRFEGLTPTEFVDVAHCRFLGPLAAGIRFENAANHIAISNCVFSQGKAGVEFSGPDRVFNDLLFVGNTFYQLEHGIVFTHMPAAGESKALGLYNNLFAGMHGAEFAVEQGLAAKQLDALLQKEGSGLGHNWSDREAPSSTAAGEFPIFKNGGKQGVKKLEFRSTDPDSSNYLVPAPDSAPAKAEVGAGLAK